LGRKGRKKMNSWEDYGVILVVFAIVAVGLISAGARIGKTSLTSQLKSIKEDFAAIKSIQSGETSFLIRPILLLLQIYFSLIVIFSSIVYLFTLPFRNKEVAS
jgi:hypothetical protein